MKDECNLERCAVHQATYSLSVTDEQLLFNNI